MYENKLAAVIAAAGYSSRMKDFKPLLPLGDFTVLESSVNSFLKAGIMDITVVVGFKADRIIPTLDKLNVKYVLNDKYNEGMYSSVITGINTLSPDVQGLFFLPVDIPLVKSETIANLSKVFGEVKKDIIYPVYNCRRGHPPLISSRLFPQILKYDGLGGLKTLLSRHQEHAYNLEVADEGILFDIDTYEDYLELCNRLLYENS